MSSTIVRPPLTYFRGPMGRLLFRVDPYSCDLSVLVPFSPLYLRAIIVSLQSSPGLSLPTVLSCYWSFAFPP